MDIMQAKAAFRAYLNGALNGAPERFFAEKSALNVCHPFNRLEGAAGWETGFLSPLRTAFDHLTRADYMAFAGTYEGATWVTSTGYYQGHWARPFLGIAPTGTMANLRFGEFHRMEDGQAVESYIYLDLPELMIAANAWPISQSPGRDRGFTGYLPGPAQMDGMQWQENDPARSQSSYQMVTDMLHGLATPDEQWRPYWHPDMSWYGPAAFGSFKGIEHFAGFQVPFEGAFDEWIGGATPGSRTRHFTRFGDGDYVCSGGWPSLNCLQSKPFLGQPSEGKRLYMRVCDWWKREGDLLTENWVFVDIPHVLLQQGVDLFPDFHPGAETVLADLPKD